MTFSWSPERHGPQQTPAQGTGKGDGLSDLRARKQVQWHCWMKPGHGVGVREDFSWNTVALDQKKIMKNLVSKCKMLSLSSRALFRLFPLSYSRLAYCSSCGPYTEATSCRLRPPAPEAELCDPMNMCSSLRSPLQRNCLFTFPGAWLECKSLKETEKPHHVHRVYSGPIQRVAHRRAQ